MNPWPPPWRWRGDLLQPVVRSSPAALDSLLDPEFQEVGASGRLWTRGDTIQAWTRDQQDAPTPIRDEQMTGRHLADHLVLLTYTSDESGRRARRTSLWRFDKAGWMATSTPPGHTHQLNGSTPEAGRTHVIRGLAGDPLGS